MIIIELKKYYTITKMKKLIKIIFFISLNFFILISLSAKAVEKIQIGLLIPMTGSDKELGQSIIKAVRLALKDIDSDTIEIIPRDTASEANQTLKSAYELKDMGVKIVIGPIFFESLTYLDEIKDLTFLSLTNKTLDIPKNVISTGINSISQLNTIKKFLICKILNSFLEWVENKNLKRHLIIYWNILFRVNFYDN